MHLRLQTAIAVTLVMSAITAASAVETGTENDPVCTGRAPFREVAQDEIRTIPELCGLHDQILRGDPDWQGGSADPIRKEFEPPDPSAARRAALQPRHRHY